MRRTCVTIGIAALVFCTLQSISVSADLTTEEAEAAYKTLTHSPAASIPVHTATTSDGSRFSIIGAADLTPPKPPNPTPTPTPTLAVKLWFELVNVDQPTGRFVNPEKHKFQKVERFRIWIDSATPITVAISQYFPDSGLGGKPVYPDAKYPSTFGVIPPARPYPLPVLFAMDDTLEDEHMMIAISDATTSGSGIAWPAAQLSALNASATTQAANQSQLPVTGAGPFINTATTTPAVAGGTSRFLATVSDKIVETAASDLKGQNRFTIVPPGQSATPVNPPLISDKPADVQSILLHGNGTGVATFQLHKD